MVGDFFDCAAIAGVIGSGTTATIARTACSAGVSMLEARVDGAIGSLWDYDTLHLAGSADLRDADQDYDLETIDRGEAHARWARTGTSSELRFDGVFEGHSVSDAPAVNAIRARFSGLL